MSTPLHDVDALVALTEANDPEVRGWANLSLCLHAPERAAALPDDGYDAALCMALGAPVCARSILAGLRGADTDAALAVRAEQLSAFGLAPVGDESWVQPVRDAIVGDGRDSDLYWAQLLADLGQLDGASLKAASAVTSEDASFAMPPLVVRFAAARGAGDAAAAEVVASLSGADPQQLANLYALLGAPHWLPHTDSAEPEALVAEVEAQLGGALPRVSGAKGSPRRRAQKWARGLLDGKTDALSCFIRASAAAELGAPWQWVHAAAWRASAQEADAVSQVVERLAGEDRAVLARARRAVSADDDARIVASLGLQDVVVHPAVLLAADRRGGPLHRPMTDALLERFLRHPGVDLRGEVALTVMLGHDADRLVALLDDDSVRQAALIFARLAATEEVLERLLAWPEPEDALAADLLAVSLAGMGEAATVPRLRALCDRWGSEDARSALAFVERLVRA